MRTTRNALALVAICGAGAPLALGENPTLAPMQRTQRALIAGHIYYNAATGERVAMPIEARPRNLSSAYWINNNTDPCATGGTVGIIDDVDLDADGLGDLFNGACVGGTFPCEGSWYNWWGDIQFDTVVDCLIVAYAINAPDLDADSDSIGDGIIGYDLTLTFSDNDNGFGADLPGLSGRSCILDLAITTIPGQVGSLPAGFMAVYLLTLDFASTAPSLVFELGDSNGIDDAGTGLSGGALYGPANGFPNTSGQDKDGDSLADFSYAMRFDQSSLGTTGAPGLTKGANGFLSVAPNLGNPGDTNPIAPPTGIFDAIDIYSSGPSCPPDTTEPIGWFFYGGFTCAQPSPVPFASSYLEIYGSICRCTSSCPANFDGSPLPADFTDALTFLVDFSGACTDGIGNFDYSSGGTPTDCDFADVLAFLTNFGSAECGN